MIGQVISHYKILEKLGEGGMGVVYKAQDTKLDRMVALKFLPREFHGVGANGDSPVARFHHEAKAAAALDHTNICNIYEIDEADDGQMFIAMALYEGETIHEMVKKGPLSIDNNSREERCSQHLSSFNSVVQSEASALFSCSALISHRS